MTKRSHHSLQELICRVPYKIIAYLAIHTFGIRLLYPGTIGFLQLILGKLRNLFIVY